jgi:hypothetical protein
MTRRSRHSLEIQRYGNTIPPFTHIGDPPIEIDPVSLGNREIWLRVNHETDGPCRLYRGRSAIEHGASWCMDDHMSWHVGLIGMPNRPASTHDEGESNRDSVHDGIIGAASAFVNTAIERGAP